MLSQQRLAVWCFASCLVTTVSCLVFTFGHAWSQRYLFGIHIWSCLVTTLAVWCSSLDRREHHCYAIWCSRFGQLNLVMLGHNVSCLVFQFGQEGTPLLCHLVFSFGQLSLVMLGHNVSCLVFQFGQEGTPLLCHLVFSFGQLNLVMLGHNVSCLVFTFGHAWSQRYLFGIHIWSCLVTTLSVWCSSLDRREHHCYAIWCSRLVSSGPCLAVWFPVWSAHVTIV